LHESCAAYENGALYKFKGQWRRIHRTRKLGPPNMFKDEKNLLLENILNTFWSTPPQCMNRVVHRPGSALPIALLRS